MKKVDSVIAVAGWEDRCVLGIERDLDTYQPSELVLVVFEDYTDLTDKHRAQLRQCADKRSVRYEEVLVVRTKPASVWKALQTRFSAGIPSGHSALVDITTMPREVIWWIFAALEKAGSTVSYVYYRPQQYAAGWVTRDTDQPRLVYQLSGVTDFSRRTCLLLISGFDADRASQLIQFFEPAAVVIGLQTGSQFKNQTYNIERNMTALARIQPTRFFEMDAYSPDHGLASMEAELGGEFGEFNVVAASLGPKLSAIALYQLNEKRNELALAYAASRQINPEYSTGIGDPVTGVLRRLEQNS